MRFAQLDRRADREAALADATTRIMSALRKLSEGSIQAV
jgi:hypothetical protein